MLTPALLMRMQMFREVPIMFPVHLLCARHCSRHWRWSMDETDKKKKTLPSWSWHSSNIIEWGEKPILEKCSSGRGPGGVEHGKNLDLDVCHKHWLFLSGTNHSPCGLQKWHQFFTCPYIHTLCQKILQYSLTLILDLVMWLALANKILANVMQAGA